MLGLVHELIGGSSRDWWRWHRLGLLLEDLGRWRLHRVSKLRGHDLGDLAG